MYRPGAEVAWRGNGSIDWELSPRTLPQPCKRFLVVISSALCWPNGWRPNPKCSFSTVRLSGVDIRNKQGIYEVIRKLAKEGVAILLISDEIPEVYFNTDRVLHMREGRLVGEFVPGETSEEALTEAVFA